MTAMKRLSEYWQNTMERVIEIHQLSSSHIER